MSSDSVVAQERSELSDLLDRLGPDQPTLCDGWQTRDLAAHLVVRESRPDASVGIVVGPLSGWTDKVQAAAARRPYDELVDKVRNGPPRLSFFSLPGVEGNANTLEYFVHHEDVLRAQPDWQPRHLPESTRTELWKRLRGASKMLFRNSAVDVVLVPTDVPDPGTPPVRPGAVTLSGPVAELTMHAFGRTAVRDLEILGDPAVVAIYTEASRGV